MLALPSPLGVACCLPRPGPGAICPREILQEQCRRVTAYGSKLEGCQWNSLWQTKKTPRKYKIHFNHWQCLDMGRRWAAAVLRLGTFPCPGKLCLRLVAREGEAQAELCDGDSCRGNSTLPPLLFVWFIEEGVKGIEGSRGSRKDSKRQTDSGFISKGYLSARSSLLNKGT